MTSVDAITDRKTLVITSSFLTCKKFCLKAHLVIPSPLYFTSGRNADLLIVSSTFNIRGRELMLKVILHITYDCCCI